jgi:signal peptidase II
MHEFVGIDERTEESRAFSVHSPPECATIGRMNAYPMPGQPIHWGKWLRLGVTAGLMLALDQISKLWVIDNLPIGLSSQPIPALAPFFQITAIFLVIAVVVTIGMIVFYPRVRPAAYGIQVALGLVMAGAIGNAIDRLRYDAVIDFIHYTIPGVISNVSNLADHAIVFGVIALVLLTWREEDRQIAESAEPNP